MFHVCFFFCNNTITQYSVIYHWTEHVCKIYIFVLVLVVSHVCFFLQQHNYTVTTSTRTRKRSIYINCSIFNNSYLDWCFYCDCSCSCVIMLLLLLFICHCASTITYEAEQNDIVTTTKTTTTNRFIYINCEIFFFHISIVVTLWCCGCSCSGWVVDPQWQMNKKNE